MAKRNLPWHGEGSDAYLSPRNPQTGNGRTKRDIFDRVINVFRTADGKKVPGKMAPVKDQRGKKGK